MIFNFKKRISISIASVIIISGFLFTNYSALASTLIFFNSNIQHVYSGDDFTVDLKVSSDKSINVIDGTLIYNKNNLEIKNISLEGSLISLWPTPATFDNNKGQLG